MREGEDERTFCDGAAFVVCVGGVSRVGRRVRRVVSGHGLAHLPRVRGRVAFLGRIGTGIRGLSSIVGAISRRVDAGRNSCCVVLRTSPAVRTHFVTMSASRIGQLLARRLRALRGLGGHFSHSTIRVTFVNCRHRKGDYFLRSVSKLGGGMVPTCDNADYAKTMSMLRGISGSLRIRVRFCSRRTFLGVMRRGLQVFFPGGSFAIDYLGSLGCVSLSNFIYSSPRLSLRFGGFGSTFVSRVSICRALVKRKGIVASSRSRVVRRISRCRRFSSVPTNSSPSLFARGRGLSSRKGGVTI